MNGLFEVVKGGIRYYMNDTEYAHKDEWIAAIQDEVKLREESWQMRKKALYEKWEKEETPFK